MTWCGSFSAITMLNSRHPGSLVEAAAFSLAASMNLSIWSGAISRLMALTIYGPDWAVAWSARIGTSIQTPPAIAIGAAGMMIDFRIMGSSPRGLWVYGRRIGPPRESQSNAGARQIGKTRAAAPAPPGSRLSPPERFDPIEHGGAPGCET